MPHTYTEVIRVKLLSTILFLFQELADGPQHLPRRRPRPRGLGEQVRPPGRQISGQTRQRPPRRLSSFLLSLCTSDSVRVQRPPRVRLPVGEPRPGRDGPGGERDGPPPQFGQKLSQAAPALRQS